MKDGLTHGLTYIVDSLPMMDEAKTAIKEQIFQAPSIRKGARKIASRASPRKKSNHQPAAPVISQLENQSADVEGAVVVKDENLGAGVGLDETLVVRDEEPMDTKEVKPTRKRRSGGSLDSQPLANISSMLSSTRRVDLPVFIDSPKRRMMTFNRAIKRAYNSMQWIDETASPLGRMSGNWKETMKPR